MGCEPLGKFFGPTRPFFPHDVGAQMSTSRYLGKWAYFALRSLLLVFLFATFGVLLSSEWGFDTTFVTNWSYLVYLVAQFLLTLCTVMPANMLDITAKIAMPLYFTAATAAFLITPVFWILLFKPPLMYRTVAVHGGTLLVFLVDLLAGTNVRFTIQMTVFPVVMLLTYIFFLWIRYAVWRNHPDFFWPYRFINPDTYGGNIGILIGIYIGFSAYTVSSGIVVILLNRLFHKCFPSKNEAFDQEPELTAPESQA